MIFPITCAECPFQCSKLKAVDDHLMSAWEWMGGKKKKANPQQSSSQVNKTTGTGGHTKDKMILNHTKICKVVK